MNRETRRMGKNKYSESEIRCAINYALESWIVLFPFFNYRFKLQEAVMNFLKAYDDEDEMGDGI